MIYPIVIKKDILEREVNNIKSNVSLCYDGKNVFIMSENENLLTKKVHTSEFAFSPDELNNILIKNDLDNYELITSKGKLTIPSDLHNKLLENYDNFINEVDQSPILFNIINGKFSNNDIFPQKLSDNAFLKICKKFNVEPVLLEGYMWANIKKQTQEYVKDNINKPDFNWIFQLSVKDLEKQINKFINKQKQINKSEEISL